LNEQEKNNDYLFVVVVVKYEWKGAWFYDLMFFLGSRMVL